MMNLHVSVATIDKRLQIARADQGFYEYVGFENYISLVKVVHPDDLEYFRETVEKLLEGESAKLVARVRKADGEYREMLIALLGLPLKKETEPYVEIRVQDVGNLEDTLGQVRDENRICSEFLDFFGDYLFRYDAAQDFFRIFRGGELNRTFAFRGTLGQFEETMLQKGLVGEAYRADFRNLCGDIAGGTKNFEYRLLLLDPSIDPQHDIHIVQGKTVQNERKEPVVLGCIHCRSDSGGKEQYMQKDFEMDVTTGLLAKKAITAYAENLLRRKPKYNINFCVVDIDNFKQVNDTLGHLYGDRVLAEVSDIIKQAAAGKGLVGRIGGDEMFLVLEGIHTLDHLRGILRSIRSNVEWTYREREGVPDVTCSIGVSTYPGDAKNYDDLFKIADKMLYRAKEKGKNRYIVYAPDVHGDVLSESGNAAVTKGGGKREDREEIVLRLLECLAKQQNQPFGAMLKDIGTTFGLDEVALFYSDGERASIACCWDVEEGICPAEPIAACIGEENFVHLYKGHKIAVIDRTDMIEQICPQTYRYLARRGIKAALIYEMKFARHKGCIGYCKKSELTRKWSDGDKENLTYISKVIELMLNDQ